MALSTVLAPNIVNLSKLALFICHLFVDGQFRFVHILHDSKVLHINQLLSEIQSMCPQPIPWLSNDLIDSPSMHSTGSMASMDLITFTPSMPCKSTYRSDQILQLIFFDLDNIPASTIAFKYFITFYHIIVFISTDDLMFHNRMAVLRKSTSNPLSKSIILLYNSTNLLIYDGFDSNERRQNMNFALENISKFEFSNAKHPAASADRRTVASDGNIFEITFKTYNEKWKIAISYGITIPYNQAKNVDKIYEILDGNPFFANFFLWNLNATQIVSTTLHANGTRSSRVHKTNNNTGQVYKELSTQYESIDAGKFK